MNFNLRVTSAEDYPELCDWWDYWRWVDSKPSLDLLDHLKFGLMVSSETENICAGFVYFTNATSYGLIEFIVSNPNVKDKEVRKEALIYLIACLKEFGKKNGMKVIITYLVNNNLIDKFLETGFVVGDKNTTGMICKL